MEKEMMEPIETSIRTLKGVTGILAVMALRDRAVEPDELPYSFDVLEDMVRKTYRTLEQLFER